MPVISWTVRFGALLLFCGLASAATITFTSGMQVPESITPIPGGFGSLTGYLIPDPTNLSGTPDIGSTIWQVSPTGQLSTFATSQFSLRDGMFMPGDFGAFGGDYAVSGFWGNAVDGFDLSKPGGAISMYDSDGNLAGSINTVFAPLSTVIAPDAYGAIAGDLLVAYTEPGQAGIAVFDSDGNELSDLVTENTFAPYYMTAAPDGFGGFGGDLFLTDDREPYVWEVGTNGTLTRFATVPDAGSTRFIGFAPSAFGAWAGDMIVGVPGSSLDANDGFLYVVDSNGNTIARLTGLNPRGFTFTADGTHMLLNITDPGVQLVAPSDFTQPAPEPGSAVLVGLGLLAAAAVKRRLR